MQTLQGTPHPVTFINTGSALAPEVSLYALSKRHFSQWGPLLAAQSSGNVRFVNVNFQHMYGPADDPTTFTTHVLHACHRNEPVLELTAGEQERDFIYIDDVVSAYSTLLIPCHFRDAIPEIDIGSGMAPTLRYCTETVHRLTTSRTDFQFGALPYRAHEVIHCVANVERMKQLGWHPPFDLEAGLRKTIALEEF